MAAAGEQGFWREQSAGFGVDADGMIDPGWARHVIAGYRTLLAEVSTDASRITDKLPQNFLYLGPIHTALPNARIIHCRRHPVDTCLSTYFTHFALGMSYSYDREWIVSTYRHYVQMMHHWRRTLPTTSFLEIDYQDVVVDREATTRRLIEFCGLEWSDACLRPEQNRRAIKTASVWQARQPVYTTSVARWQNYEPWLGAFRDLLPVAPSA